MFSYFIRRLLYTVPIILGVMVVTFLLFFAIQKPDTMARVRLGKRATPEAVATWLHNRGYDKPRFLNTEPGEHFYNSIFFDQMKRFATFDFGNSDVTGRPLKDVFKTGAIPSLLITVPAFFAGLATAVAFALVLVFLRHSPLDTGGTILCVVLMSLPTMIYIIFGQALVAIGLKYFPAFGYELHGLSTAKFLILPVILMVVIGLGSDTRLYRTIFLEEYGQDYVRTAFAKGVPISRVMWIHVLKNGMIALITLTVAHLPVLILGSLLMENFFGIPGLGNTLYLAIQTTDFATVQAFVFIGALLIQAGLIATDFCYALVDPRIRLGGASTTSATSFKQILSFGAVVAICAFLVRWVSTQPWPRVGQALDRIWTRLESFFNQLWVQNTLIVAGFALVFGLICLGSRNERWRRAFKYLRRDRLGIVSGLAILVYLFVGALEMIQVPRGPGGSGISVLDWMTQSIATEKSYSAPLADHSLSVAKPEPLLTPGRHLLGTDALGKDTLVQTLKACRTALIIGGVTSAIYIPVGALLGILAGYYRRWVDDIIQFFYSTISSIPDILFLVAFLLVLGKGLGKMSFALGITAWVGLCRLIRGEVLRQSERQYVAAARSIGQSHWKIITRHLLPNVMHLILINFVLGFSGLVLVEATLSYLGVGAPLGTASWGAMINGARSELSREPLVWWNITAATTALFFLVLSLNLFGDALRRAFDPRQG